MSRPLWLEKLSDEQLNEMISYTETIDIVGGTTNDKVLTVIDTWYHQKTVLEKLMAFCIDVWKEAAYRWHKTQNIDAECKSCYRFYSGSCSGIENRHREEINDYNRCSGYLRIRLQEGVKP